MQANTHHLFPRAKTTQNEGPQLVAIEGPTRLDDAKVELISNELREAIAPILQKHDIDFTRFIAKAHGTKELSLLIRGSVIDANNMDALHRDLLNFCSDERYRFKAGIMTASIIAHQVEYQVTGLDLSTAHTKFRLRACVDGSIAWMDFDLMKQALPNYFY